VGETRASASLPRAGSGETTCPVGTADEGKFRSDSSDTSPKSGALHSKMADEIFTMNELSRGLWQEIAFTDTTNFHDGLP